jgi:hypothetical protein
MSKVLRAPVTPSMRWWVEHVAEHEKLTVAEWLRMLADRAIGAHACKECDGEEPRKVHQNHARHARVRLQDDTDGPRGSSGSFYPAKPAWKKGAVCPDKPAWKKGAVGSRPIIPMIAGAILPLPSLPLVQTGQRVESSAWPRLNFDPNRLLIKNGRAWQLEDVTINDVTIFTEPGALDGALFDDYRGHLQAAVAQRLAWRRVPKDGKLTIVATFQGSDQEPDGGEFRAVCMGTWASPE